jgi:hypothetical protein
MGSGRYGSEGLKTPVPQERLWPPPRPLTVRPAETRPVSTCPKCGVRFNEARRKRVGGLSRRSKTMGWHDLALQDEKTFRWRWKGKQYGGADPLD